MILACVYDADRCLPPRHRESVRLAAIQRAAPNGTALPGTRSSCWRYRKLSSQAPKPCVAAYSLRCAGTIVSPGTSTFGIPGAAATHWRGPSQHPKHTEVRRRVQIARHIVEDDVRDWDVAEVVTAIDPGGGTGGRVVRHVEHMPWCRGRRGIEPAIGDQGAVRVHRIDVNAAHEPVGIRSRQAVEPAKGDGARGIRVGVLRDEYATRARRRPERGHIRRRALDCRDDAARPIGSIERAGRGETRRRVGAGAGRNGNGCLTYVVAPKGSQSPQKSSNCPNHSLHRWRKAAWSRAPIPHVFVRQT